MTKRVFSILISLLLLSISIGLLITYFVFNSDKDEFKPLSLLCNNISIFVGDCFYNFYQISHEGASIVFDVSKENIIQVDSEKIVGLNAGQVDVTLTATFENQMAKTKMQVTVLNEDYTFLITPIQNCYYDDKTLFLNNDICLFQIDIFDQLNNKLENLSCQVTTSNNALIYQQIYLFQLYSPANSTIVFYYEEIDSSIVINVKRVT